MLTTGECSRPGYPVTIDAGCTTGPGIDQTKTICQRNHGKNNETWATIYEKSCPGILGTIVDVREKCVKTGWNPVNKLGCCLGNVNNAKDCDPKWCFSSESCNSVLTDYCKDPNNIESSKCIEFCSDPSRKGMCDYGLKNYCTTDNISKKVCKEFCRLHDQDGMCNEEVNEWCARPENKNNEYCNCFNADTALHEEYPASPVCFDDKCRSGASYRPRNMYNVNCPNICSQVINTIKTGGDVKVDHNIFEQSCGFPFPSEKKPYPTPGTYTRYSCNDGQCVENPEGFYTSSDCDGECVGTEKKYTCVYGKCTENPDGTLNHKECLEKCEHKKDKSMTWIIIGVVVVLILILIIVTVAMI